MSNILTSVLRKPSGTGYFDGAISGASEALFPEASYGSIQERFIFNPNLTGSFWLNIYGGTAAANTADCVEIAPGTGMTWSFINAVTIIGTAAAAITWGER